MNSRTRRAGFPARSEVRNQMPAVAHSSRQSFWNCCGQECRYEARRGVGLAFWVGRSGARLRVAQVSNLLYRRLPVGRTSKEVVALETHRGCGLETRDTADWKSALQLLNHRRTGDGKRTVKGGQECPRSDR